MNPPHSTRNFDCRREGSRIPLGLFPLRPPRADSVPPLQDFIALGVRLIASLHFILLPFLLLMFFLWLDPTRFLKQRFMVLASLGFVPHLYHDPPLD